MFHVSNKNRIRRGKVASTDDDGNNRYFAFPPEGSRSALFVIASDGEGWEHVSVHAAHGLNSKTPTWKEMCFIKDIFWDEDDVVVQYHPSKKDYVNNHPWTLHLWRPIGIGLPVPERILV